MWIPYAFWPSLAATVIAAILVYMVIVSNIRKPGNLAAFVMFFSMLIWSIGELIERIAGPPPANPAFHYLGSISLSPGPYDGNLAYMGAVILCFGIFLVSAGIIHFALDYPFKLKMERKTRKAVLYTVYGFSFAGMIANILNQFIGHPTVAYMYPYKAMGEWIWGLESGPLHSLYSIWLFVSAIIMIIILLIKLRSVRMDIIKKQILITITGFVITFVLLTVTALIPMVIEKKNNSYPMTTLGFTIFGIFVMYTIVRYRLFLVAPSTEIVELEEELPDSGVYEMSKEEAYHKFARLARSGNPGTGFIGENAEEFKKKYKLVQTTVFELSQSTGKNKLNPENPEQQEMLYFTITSLLEHVYKPIILLDLSLPWMKEDTKKSVLEKIKEINKEYGGVFLIVK
ncbi:hypothetical protein AciM339_1500 [Aciduliprofundum sp. MAR08-339]|uniref:histidine kinase N-terminal 7TM domain-containing protein n=1 Tax=Aciduliprofundum sp. (strain MAR08-339) TaxID=673860 RepID=UPI0002A4B51D|nr:hypothetical protein AciM339_1500 [Aciduliprofundum sp. MAR08-339]